MLLCVTVSLSGGNISLQRTCVP